MNMTTTQTRPLNPITRWVLGLDCGQVLPTITWTAGSLAMLAGPLLRRGRRQTGSVTTLTGVAVPATRAGSGEDCVWSPERRARHEAVHAVAGTTVGGHVTLVNIESVGIRGGLTVTEHHHKRLPDYAWARLVTPVAGQLVDVEAGAYDYGSGSDMVRALEAVTACRRASVRPATTASSPPTRCSPPRVRLRAAAISKHSEVLDSLVGALLDDPARPLRGPALDSLLAPITRTAREESA